jgi:hypothetical protein
VKLALGVVLILIGVVWAMQGLDVSFVPSSQMTGDRTWVVWGGVLAAAGVAIIWWHRRTR